MYVQVKISSKILDEQIQNTIQNHNKDIQNNHSKQMENNKKAQ